jgi:hypothetical protein
MGIVGGFAFEQPVHHVSILKPSYLGRREVTFDEWDAYAAERCCQYRPDDRGQARELRPVIDVDWEDAKAPSDDCPARPVAPIACRPSAAAPLTTTRGICALRLGLRTTMTCAIAPTVSASSRRTALDRAGEGIGVRLRLATFSFRTSGKARGVSLGPTTVEAAP